MVFILFFNALVLGDVSRRVQFFRFSVERKSWDLLVWLGCNGSFWVLRDLSRSNWKGWKDS